MGKQHLQRFRVKFSLVALAVFQGFLALHPKVKIDLKRNDNLIDLVEQGVDIAVRIGVSQATVVASQRYIDALPSDRPMPKTPED